MHKFKQDLALKAARKTANRLQKGSEGGDTLQTPTLNSKAFMMASGFHSAGAAKFGGERKAAAEGRGLCCTAAIDNLFSRTQPDRAA